MKPYIRFSGLLLIFISASIFGQQKSTLTDYYHSADSVTKYPWVEKRLGIVCAKQIGQVYCTFIGYEGENAPFIAAITAEPIKNPNSEISRSVEFREIVPTAGKVATWGYIFDRNNDGRIDYLALVDGAAAVEPPKFPPTFPLRKKQMSAKQQEYFINNCAIIFSHWADENYDGRIDAGVVPDLDSLRDWVQRRIAFRSTKGNGTIDVAWGFLRSTNEAHRKVAIRKGKFEHRSLDNTLEAISGKTLDEKTTLLQLIDNAAAGCGLGPGSFPH
jgi:hypothetical protein